MRPGDREKYEKIIRLLRELRPLFDELASDDREVTVCSTCRVEVDFRSTMSRSETFPFCPECDQMVEGHTERVMESEMEG